MRIACANDVRTAQLAQDADEDGQRREQKPSPSSQSPLPPSSFIAPAIETNRSKNVAAISV